MSMYACWVLLLRYDENQSTADEWKPYSSSFVIRYYDLKYQKMWTNQSSRVPTISCLSIADIQSSKIQFDMNN